MKYMMLGVTLCLMLVLGVVFLTNRENENKRKETSAQQQNVVALEHDTQENAAALEPDAQGQMAGTDAAGHSVSSGTVTSDSSNTAQIAAADEQPLTGIAADGSEVEPAPQPAAETVTGFNGRKSLEDVERLYAERKLVASDLDFWDMYPVNEPDIVSAANGTQPEMRSGEQDNADNEASEKPRDKYAQYDEEMKKKEENDPSKDGKHTLITLANGEEEWVLINPYLEQNTYDFTKLTVESNNMLTYEDGRKASYAGVDLSKYNGQVDFLSLKQEGIDYVMLRVGARGYETGQIMLDEKFTEYITGAVQAGLGIGVYFYSQAITEAEAVEEANFVISQVANYQLTYPVAFDMEYISNDSARIDGLTRDEKTKIAAAFMDTVKNAGYKPMLYGTKEWLIKQVDLTKLTGYDVWLSSQEAAPDYPYLFQMWQYSLDGKIDGITGNVDLNISFVDYSAK